MTRFGGEVESTVARTPLQFDRSSGQPMFGWAKPANSKANTWSFKKNVRCVLAGLHAVMRSSTWKLGVGIGMKNGQITENLQLGAWFACTVSFDNRSTSFIDVTVLTYQLVGPVLFWEICSTPLCSQGDLMICMYFSCERRECYKINVTICIFKCVRRSAHVWTMPYIFLMFKHLFESNSKSFSSL